MKNNPFTLSFGNIPLTEIERTALDFDIVEDFLREQSTSNAYMITGVRGSGKTVYMTDICKKFKEKEDWIVVEVTPEDDILKSIVYKLAKNTFVNQYAVKAKIDLSFLQVEIGKNKNSEDIPYDILLEQLLTALSKKKKRVLVAIDEAINNIFIKDFAHNFQIYIRNELPIYLIMTGLYENIYEIQNEKTLTFLYRTPRIEMKPLRRFKIVQSYVSYLEIPEEKAKALADATKGYAFAYQVIGYFSFESKNKKLKELEDKFCEYLGEYVYEKIWSEMSENDRNVVIAMLDMGETIKVKDLRDKLGVNSANFSHYRDRLKRKGIIDVSQYGYLSFSLPYFAEYIKREYL